MRQFYEHQQDAYASSARLVLLLAAAIAGTVVLSGASITYLIAVWFLLNGMHPFQHVTAMAVTFAIACIVCSLIIATGTIVKLFQLRNGGRVIAEDLGGRLISEPGSPYERQLTNLVEELSIASGIPVPPVYVMDANDSINAFAAGYDPREAVLGVTQGAIRHLNRDQLQGVLAHEFSHILNGDMRLNLRMVGWMHGVLSVTIVAEMMIYSGYEMLAKPTRLGTQGLPLHGLVLIAIGCALWPVGLIGTLMSLLVKSATNRQQEFLADAFAVQFTRHPDGLADAFKRLAGHSAGSRVKSPKAIEASHLFFAEGCGRWASRFASHPPLAARILRLDPSWDGVPLFPEESDISEYHGAFEGAMGLVSPTQPPDTTDTEPDDWLDDRVREVPELIAAVEFTESVLRSLPDPVVEITQIPGGNSLLLYGLWLAHAKDESAAYALFSELEAQRITPLVPYLQQMEPSQQVLLLDTALEQLEQTDGPERRELRKNFQRLVELCEEGNLFQWMCSAAIGETLGLAEKRKPRYGRLKQVEGACEVLLSHVCYAGGSTGVSGFSFQRGLANLGLDNLCLVAREDCNWDNFQLAVELVSQLAPAPRRQVLLACSSALSSDQLVTPDEAYIIRGISQRLGYEVPGVLPGQPIIPGT